MAANYQILGRVSHAAYIFASAQHGIRVVEALTSKRRPAAEELEESAKQLKCQASAVASVIPDVDSISSSLSSIAQQSVQLLEDVAAHADELNADDLRKKSMLEKFKLKKKPSHSDIQWEQRTGLRFKDVLARLDKLISPSLQEQVDDYLKELSLLDRIEPAQIIMLRETSASLQAAVDCPAAASPALKVMQQLLPQIQQLVAKLEQAVALNALKFSKLHERFDSITMAEADTYAWLLPTSDASGLGAHLVAAKKTFLDWLETSSGFFYSSGKPGAGKSTLMKFICRDQQFYDCGSKWAGDSKLVVGRFFFWKPGQSEQKSINGMLRGLLYSILESQPDIAAIALPELCDSLGNDRPLSVRDADVKTAFENMLKTFGSNGKYAILLVLDGLDEFEGEHASLLALMQSWVSEYPSTIKICVSSREYGIFEDFFAKSPKFRLHELTKNDMSLLIASRFGTSKAFAKLPGGNLDDVTPLIIDRAEGVFLWVILAIASLEDGMESGDITNAMELEGSIRRLPTELDDLLGHLHRSVSEHNRPWAYKAITLVHFAQFRMAGLLASGDGYPGVGLLDHMLLDEAASSTWSLSMFAPRADDKAEDPEARLEVARRKMICRPRGFLAVSNLPNVRNWPATGADKLYVTFTHRSIVEYLSEEAATGLMDKYIGSFDPFFALMSTDLAALRFSQPSNYPLLKDNLSLPVGSSVELSSVLADSLMMRFREMIEAAFAMEKAGSTRFLSILDAVGDAIKRHLTLQLPLRRIRLAQEENSPHQVLINLALGNSVFEYSEWKRKQPMQPNGKNHISSSLFHGFRTMLEHCSVGAKTTASIPNINSGQPLRVINEGSETDSKVTPERLWRVFEEFFENGLDINHRWHGTWAATTVAAENAWSSWDALLWAITCGDFPHPTKTADILQLCMQHGAKLETVIIGDEPTGPLEMEELEPPEGWYHVSPNRSTAQGADKVSIPADREDGARSAWLSPVLLHESSVVLRRAKQLGWRFTARDLVELKFPDAEALKKETK